MLERKWRNFWCALGAVRTAWQEEPSLRVQVCLTAFFFALGYSYGISRIEWSLLVLAFTGVITTELINTAIERVGNAFARQNDPLIGLIKDLGAAASCTIGIGAIIIVAIIFVPYFL